MSTGEEKPKKGSIWGGVFGLLDKLQLKDTVTRNFIFRPPSATYNFVPKTSLVNPTGMNFAFEPKDKSRLLKDENIKIKAFKIYRERKNALYMTPLILVRNRKKESDYLMIYSHGNSCDLGTIYRSTIAFSDVVKMDVLAYDYTGYGISPNKSSEENTYRDLETVLSFAVGQLNHPLDKIILCGYSLGSGPTVEMATRFQSLPFIVLLAPLASCLSVISKAKGQKSSHDIFNNIAKMPKVWCDLLIVHGKDDRTISSNHSKELIQAYISTHSNPPNKGFLLEVDDIDHQNLFSELREEDSPYTITFKKYLKSLLADNYAYSHLQNKEPAEKPVEKKVEEKEGKITETDSNEEEEEKKENDYREIYRRMKQETGDLDDVRRMSEEESEGWNSSVLFSENTNTKPSSSLAGKLVKYETEYLKDLFTKISVNKPPEKYNKKKDDSPANNQFLLYRKVMF